MQLKDYTKAMEDAELCTQNKPTWAKGWNRLGEAQACRGCYKEAIVAYNRAIELEPDKAEYKTAKADAEAKQKRAQSAGASYGKASGGTAVQFGSRDGVHLFIRLLMFTNAALYLFSLTTNQKYLSAKFRTALQFFMISSVLNFAANHGFPKFNTAFLQRVMVDPAVQRVFGAILLFMGHNFMALVALLLPEAAALVSSIVKLLKKVGQNSLALRLTAALEGVVLDGHGNPYWKIVQWAAYAEVSTGVILVISLPLPTRNFVLLALYWQFLQMRYILEKATGNTSGVLHVAFNHLDQRIMSVVSHRFCPGLLKMGYQFCEVYDRSDGGNTSTRGKRHR
eukprot:FR734665.1.p1 GENE.FR734665.1~~FR734665.1.p1  ORF type:complete len:338 (+),score=68.92 FR734665.1:3-1016(+)